MEDLLAYESEVHELCGLHESIASTDPNLRLEPTTCPACAGVAVALRVQAELDKADEPPTNAPATTARPDDGRIWSARIITDEQVAAEAAEAAAKKPRRSKKP